MARRTARSLLLLLLLAAPALLASELTQQPRVADALTLYDLWVEEQLVYHRIPGLAVGLVAGSEVVWTKGWGVEDLASGAPVTPTTLFRLGSVTKLFTATAILQLRDAGKLALDDPVTEHLPAFSVQSPFPGAPPITLRHLLTHTSGLPREGAFPYWTTHDFPTRGEIWTALAGQTVIHPPGEVYKYSNLGMALLGHVVEAISGLSYADYLAQHVFAPLGMSRSTAAPSAEQVASLAGAYMRRMPDGSRRKHTYYDTGGMKGAASVLSTVGDLARFAALQMEDGPAAGARILSGYTLREMQRAQFVGSSWTSGRGLGFAAADSDGRTIVSHGGWIGGHRSVLMLSPVDKVAVVALTNAEDVSPTAFARELLDLAAPAIAAAADPLPAADPAWEPYYGLYSDPWGWYYRVVALDGRLTMVESSYPPVDSPADGVTRLEPTATPHVFTMGDGEAVTFHLGSDGRVEKIQRRYEYLYPEEEAP